MEWNEANASRVCIPDLDRETSVAEVEEVLHKLTVGYHQAEYSKPYR